MKEFKRFDNTITVKMGEVKFVGDPVVLESTNGMATKIVDELQAKINAGEATPSIIEESIKKMIELADSLFGAGGVSNILGRDTVSFHDMCDIFIYLKKAADEFERGKLEFYNSYDLNREEQRANTYGHINRQTSKHNKPRR